jgi:hypothetical protein
MEPGPDRTSDTWDEFIKRHGATLWGFDFFSVNPTYPSFRCSRVDHRYGFNAPCTKNPNVGARDHYTLMNSNVMRYRTLRKQQPYITIEAILASCTPIFVRCRVVVVN